MDTDASLDILETAYIEIMDCSDFDKGNVTPSKTKNILSGLMDKVNTRPDKTNRIKVQFNPETLSFSYDDSSSKNDKTSIVQNEDGNTPQAVAEDDTSAVNMSFKLVFDRSLFKDCSVQPEVEQFIALIKKPYVRKITFYWGTMCYYCLLRSIDAEYVLFNSKGVPMRANINMSLQILDRSGD
jgi:hypothetical protein